MTRCVLVWAGVLVAAATGFAAPARANEAGVYQLGRVTISAPGWAEAPTSPGPVPILLSIDLADPSTETYLHCDVNQAALPPNPGWTQDTVNQRIVNDGASFLEQSPALRSFGRRESDSVAVVDGIAVASATAVGESSDDPNYSSVRLFILVEPDGSGLYHSITCTLWGVANEANRARLDAVANSLRFDREAQ